MNECSKDWEQPLVVTLMAICSWTKGPLFVASYLQHSHARSCRRGLFLLLGRNAYLGK